MKMGSLFSGIGGFELAAIRNGITPVWASEIEQNCVQITQRHFPDLKHYGDITKINGADLAPVDIITFGSPCQNMSNAGNREGLKGKESCLFYEAIRIFREMRNNGTAPRYLIWENVPGAFNSSDGKDFQQVLKEITEREIPMPASGRWATAGMVKRSGFSLAWRVLNAQYFGVPQRRRRIFLVADLAGDSAGEILFEREGMPRNSPQSREAGIEVARPIVSSPHRKDCADRETYVVASGFQGNNPATAGGVSYKENLSPTLQVAKPAMVQISPTLRTNYRNNSNPATEASMLIYGFAENQQHEFRLIPELHPALACNGGKPGQGYPAVFCIRTSQTGAGGSGFDKDIAHTLNTSDQDAVYWDGGQISDTLDASVLARAQTMPEKRRLGAVVERAHYMDNSGIHRFAEADHERLQQRRHNLVRRLTPLECERLQGFPDEWTLYDLEGYQIVDSVRYRALGNAIAVPCVEWILRRLVAYAEN